MQRDEGEAAIVDFYLEIVDTGIGGNDVGQQLVVALDKAAHGSAQMIFRQPTHRQQPRLQLVELLSDTAAILIHRPHHDASSLHFCYERSFMDR